MELLPEQRTVRIIQQRGTLGEHSLTGFDACIVLCNADQAESVLRRLPFAEFWQRLYREAAARGPIQHLVGRLTTDSIPSAVWFVKPGAAPFEQLASAARVWKELPVRPEAKVLLAAHEVRSAHGGPALERLLTAGLAATAPMPSAKSTRPVPSSLSEVVLLHQGGPLDVERISAVDAGNHLARWLTSLPPNVLDSEGYRRALQTLARRHGWSYTFLDDRALSKLGAGAFLAVSRANEHRNAGIARLRYRGLKRGSAAARLALVGKGICFDTGGINLKQHKGMYQMHEDMQGSAVAVGTLLALTRLKVPMDIDCWLAITENQIGARAYRPQEVVRAANGVSIQVVHSDAEGRMVLADTLALAAREQPQVILDYATLTGACVNALTERFSGAFTNRPDLHSIIEHAGRLSGERVWPFPMDEDFDSDLESPIADVLQCTMDSKGDHILAARFLNRFVPAQIPWIHLDLAASNRAGGLGHVPTDFTGFGVRFTAQLLLDEKLLDTLAKSKPKK